MELSSDINEHQKKVFAEMKANAELQAKVDASTDSDPVSIPMESFTQMLQNRTI